MPQAFVGIGDAKGPWCFAHRQQREPVGLGKTQGAHDKSSMSEALHTEHGAQHCIELVTVREGRDTFDLKCRICFFEMPLKLLPNEFTHC